MAKSLRSKWRRKCRAVKRERYGEKELARLKKTLGIDDSEKINETTMNEVSDVVTVVSAKELKEKKEEVTEDDTMESDEKKRVFNQKTMRDQNGTYPIWMHQRRLKKIKNKTKKSKPKKRATKK